MNKLVSWLSHLKAAAQSILLVIGTDRKICIDGISQQQKSYRNNLLAEQVNQECYDLQI